MVENQEKNKLARSRWLGTSLKMEVMRVFTYREHSAISQMMAAFITTVVITSYPTKLKVLDACGMQLAR
jgi:hypothetical protein